MSDTEFPPDAELLLNGDIEPDCDNDGLGDETQDTNTSACHPPQAVKKKKCKKKKHKRSAESAKKKKCKKKKKR